jgi:hypothetical protein
MMGTMWVQLRDTMIAGIVAARHQITRAPEPPPIRRKRLAPLRRQHGSGA